MKKLLILVIAAMFLVACGSDDEEAVADETEIDKTEEENVKEEEAEVEELSVEVEEQIFKKYVDTSFNAEVIGVYAKLKNTGSVLATVYNVEVTLFDSDDNPLAVENEDGSVLFSPFYLEPEDNGYIALNIDYSDNYEDLEYVEIDFDAQELDSSEMKKLEVTKQNVMKNDGFFIDEDDADEFDSVISDAVSVVFTLENNHDEELSYVVGIGFHDKEGEFVGASVPMNYVDVDYVIKAGDDKNIEDLEFLPVDYDDIGEVEINAIGIPFEYE